jgi:hypothetical protein
LGRLWRAFPIFPPIIRDYPELSGIIQNYPELSRTVRDYPVMAFFFWARVRPKEKGLLLTPLIKRPFPHPRDCSPRVTGSGSLWRTFVGQWLAENFVGIAAAGMPGDRSAHIIPECRLRPLPVIIPMSPWGQGQKKPEPMQKYGIRDARLILNPSPGPRGEWYVRKLVSGSRIIPGRLPSQPFSGPVAFGRLEVHFTQIHGHRGGPALGFNEIPSWHGQRNAFT